MTIHPTPEERWLLDRFGDLIVGLIHYGSTAFGRPRKGSTRDFWVIVDDLTAFHRRFTPPARNGNGASSVAERVRRNRHGPSFYAMENGELMLKMAVISRDTFCRRCRERSYYVKGRMQKPIRVVRADDGICAAIDHAREEAVTRALDLLPSEFDFEAFLLTLLGLSYRTEVRPEFTGRKVRSILESGRAELDAMYRVRLDAVPYVEGVNGHNHDMRPRYMKGRERRRALRACREMKYSHVALANIYRNYMSHPQPIRYIVRKIAGEFEKLRGVRKGK